METIGLAGAEADRMLSYTYLIKQRLRNSI